VKGGLFIIGAILLAGYVLFGDRISEMLGGAGVDPGQVNVPDVNDAAGQAQDAGNKAADEVSTWTPETWKIIVLLVSATVGAYLWFNSPKFKYIATGVIVALLIVVGFA
jgi:hypothetical protein